MNGSSRISHHNICEPNEAPGGFPLSGDEPDQPATITSVRNALEHGQNLAIRGGFGFASGPDG